MSKFTHVIALAAMMVSFRAANAAFALDDITFWTGAGGNRAAMVVTWSSPEVFNNTDVSAPVVTQTMVWGYRFDGAKSGEDMFNAIVAADTHLYAMVSGQTQYGKAVFALGYDANNNGVKGITDGASTYDAAYLATHNGLIPGGYGDSDYFNTIDAGDVYWGGWMGPNWELWHELGGNGGFTSEPDRGTDPYWTSGGGWAGTHGQWEFSGVGMSTLSLEDGSWMGWTVAAGGLDYGDPTSLGTLAWMEHKVAPAMVPEPASLGLLVTGVTCLLMRRRKRLAR